MPPIAKLAALLTLALLGSAAGASDIYKWVDDEGNVHYGDRPAEDVEAERLEIESRRTDPARIARLSQARAEERRSSQERLNPQAAADDEQMSPEDQRAAREERQQQCNMYKERLQTFIQSRRLYREDENGERVYLNEEEMQSARDNVQNKVEEYCDS